jgi:hypothetical protein
VDGGDSEVSGGKGRRVQRRAAKGSKKSEPKRLSFTKERREEFLGHFAASCNAEAAARAAGISDNCVYAWRKKDAPFRAAWFEALDQGYARLEAEIVRESAESLKVRADKDAAVRVGTVDPKTALAVLEAYRRSGGRGPGEVWPHPYDVESVRRRLEAKMKALGVLDAQGQPIASPPPHTPPSCPDETGEES